MFCYLGRFVTVREGVAARVEREVVAQDVEAVEEVVREYAEFEEEDEMVLPEVEVMEEVRGEVEKESQGGPMFFFLFVFIYFYCF